MYASDNSIRTPLEGANCQTQILATTQLELPLDTLDKDASAAVRMG